MAHFRIKIYAERERRFFRSLFGFLQPSGPVSIDGKRKVSIFRASRWMPSLMLNIGEWRISRWRHPSAPARRASTIPETCTLVFTIARDNGHYSKRHFQAGNCA